MGVSYRSICSISQCAKNEQKEIIILTMKLEFVLDDDQHQAWLINATNIQYKEVKKEEEILMSQ